MKKFDIDKVREDVLDILSDCDINDTLEMFIDPDERKITIYSNEIISSREIIQLSKTFEDDFITISPCNFTLQIIVDINTKKYDI
jgi:hypothetical protein